MSLLPFPSGVRWRRKEEKRSSKRRWVLVALSSNLHLVTSWATRSTSFNVMINWDLPVNTCTLSTIKWGKTRGNDVCYDTVYLGEGRGIGGKCLTETKYCSIDAALATRSLDVSLHCELRPTGRRAEGPLLAGYMIVGVGLNITDGGSAFPSPPHLPSLPPGLSPRSTTLRSLYHSV